MNRKHLVTSSLRPAVALLCFEMAAASAFAQELLDAARLVDRGVILEAPLIGPGHIGGLAGVGDVDGDGFSDVLLSMVESREDETYVTTHVVIFGRAGLSGKFTVDSSLSRTVTFRARTPAARASFNAREVSPAGDLDQDGYADFCFDRLRFPYEGGMGEAYLVFGSPALPETVYVEDIGETIRGVRFWTSENTIDGLEFRMAPIGDFNGDGEMDLAIAARDVDYGDRKYAGRVYILFGPENLRGRVDLDQVGVTVPGVRLIGAEVPGNLEERVGEGLATAVRWVGDVDGDGIDDLLVTPSFGWSPARLQRVYLIYGDRSFPAVLDLMDEEEGTNPSGHVTFLRGAGDDGLKNLQAGGLGDLNGDGHGDFLFTDPGGCPGLSVVESQVWIYYGGPDRPAEIDFLQPPPGRTVKFRPPEECIGFGHYPSPAGDLNLDGVPDFLVGATATWRDGLRGAGAMYALFARANYEPDTEILLANGFEGIKVIGQDTRDAFGEMVSAAGDFNADGAPDFVVLARNADSLTNPTDHSRAYLIYGTAGQQARLNLTTLSPSWGSVLGGTEVTIRGTGFRGLPVVKIGDSPAQSVQVISTGNLKALTPSRETLGLVDVSVEIGGGRAVLPSAFEYTEPFPQIDLAGLQGKGLVIEGADAQTFGRLSPSVASFGDLTGDGVDDLAVSSPLVNLGIWMVSLIRGRTDLPERVRAMEPSDDLTVITRSISFPNGTPNTSSAVFLGDVNGDGVADLGMGASDGVGYILLGGPDLPQEVDLESAGMRDRVVIWMREGLERFLPGPMAPLGDLTGDGIEDFALAFPGASVIADDPPARIEMAGEILFIAGRRNWPLYPDQISLEDSEYVFARIHGSSQQILGGNTLTSAGDMNGDGIPDFLTKDQPQARPNLIFVIFGQRDLPYQISIDELIAEGGAAAIKVPFGALAWLSVGPAGDVNADGFTDILIGADGGEGTIRV